MWSSQQDKRDSAKEKDPWDTGYSEDERFARTKRGYFAESDGTIASEVKTAATSATYKAPRSFGSTGSSSASSQSRTQQQTQHQRQSPKRKSALEQEFVMASAKVGAGYLLGGVFGLIFNAAARAVPTLPRPKPTIVYANSVAQAGVGIAVIDILIRHVLGRLFADNTTKKKT